MTLPNLERARSAAFVARFAVSESDVERARKFAALAVRLVWGKK